MTKAISMSIPLVDLRAQHQEVQETVRSGWDEVLARTAFVGGAEVAAFEEAYAAFTTVPHCIGVASGTDALELGMRAIDIGPGDEVIVPANSFIASAEAVRRIGATPVFVDVDDELLLIDPELAAARIGRRTRALMPVHLFGQMAPVAELQSLARAANVLLVEDAAQAQGARREGLPAGSVGDVAGTSFYPGKNLGAYGDAGAVLTTSAGVASRVRLLRDHGSQQKYEHPHLGFNSRLDTLQAVVLSAKLERLAEWNDARRTAAARYDAMLEELDAVRPPMTAPGSEHVWHLYVVRVPDRDRVLRGLHERGIGAGIHYPQPLHLTGAMSDLGYRRGAFPAAERAANEILSLPLYPQITVEQQERVIEALREAL
jgi:dTDP-4-amino-4,6-dideoxygalactose transaminase